MSVQPFCSLCGSPTQSLVPEGDNRQRAVCTVCKEIHYQNPKNVVGCLLEWQGKILLCKRAIEPRLGYWTLPAGFMENEETAMQGAAREAQEEACAECDNLKLFAIYNMPNISQLYLMFSGQLRDGKTFAGDESLEVRLFSQENIPWDDLAFPVVVETLTRHFEQRYKGDYPVHYSDIFSAPDEPLDIVRHTVL